MITKPSLVTDSIITKATKVDLPKKDSIKKEEEAHDCLYVFFPPILDMNGRGKQTNVDFYFMFTFIHSFWRCFVTNVIYFLNLWHIEFGSASTLITVRRCGRAVWLRVGSAPWSVSQIIGLHVEESVFAFSFFIGDATDHSGVIRSDSDFHTRLDNSSTTSWMEKRYSDKCSIILFAKNVEWIHFKVFFGQKCRQLFAQPIECRSDKRNINTCLVGSRWSVYTWERTCSCLFCLEMPATIRTPPMMTSNQIITTWRDELAE